MQKKQLHIAMISEAWTPIWGGGQAYVFELSKKLVENYNCRIEILTINLKDKNKHPSIENYLQNKLKVIRIGKKRNFFFKDRILWPLDVLKYIKKNNKKYDIIHGHSTYSAISTKLASWYKKIPCVYTIHGSNFQDLGDKKNILYYIETFINTIIRYDLETSVARQFLKYKNRNKPIQIPCAIDLEKIDSAVRKYKNKKEKGNINILFVGRLTTDKMKGIDILLKAISSIQEQLLEKKTRFVINGEGNNRKNLIKLARDLNIDEKLLHFQKGYGEEVLKAFANADIFILPSRAEGLPITLLEAWAAKLPVIVTAVGENPYLVNKNNGYLVQPEDAKNLREKIIVAINDKNLKRKGKNGYNLVKKNHTWDKISNEFYNHYIKLILNAK